MIRLTLLLISITFISVAYSQIPEGFTPLFTTGEFTGWDKKGNSATPGVWSWDGDTLKTTQGSTGGTGWIQYNKKMYTDFMFYCEWKCNYNGNSGFQFCIAENSQQPVWDAIEVQICEDASFTWWWEDNGFYRGDPRQISGAIYPFVGSATPQYNGINEWNTILVTSIGDTIKVELNGVEVVSADRKDYTNDVILWKKTRLALNKRPRTGYIGLQSHKGGTTFYKNLAIKDLSDVTAQVKIPMDKLTVYPNPAGNSIKIGNAKSEINVSKVSVYNSAGKVVKAELLAEDKAYFVGDLEKGIYIIKVQHNRGTSLIKFMKA